MFYSAYTKPPLKKPTQTQDKILPENSAWIHSEFIGVSTIYSDTLGDGLAGKINVCMKYGLVRRELLLSTVLWWDGDWAKVTPR